LDRSQRSCGGGGGESEGDLRGAIEQCGGDGEGGGVEGEAVGDGFERCDRRRGQRAHPGPSVDDRIWANVMLPDLSSERLLVWFYCVDPEAIEAASSQGGPSPDCSTNALIRRASDTVAARLENITASPSPLQETTNTSGGCSVQEGR
jgi:hypothetical protein